MATTIPVPMLMYGKVSQENLVELTAASAIPNFKKLVDLFISLCYAFNEHRATMEVTYERYAN